MASTVGARDRPPRMRPNGPNQAEAQAADTAIPDNPHDSSSRNCTAYFKIRGGGGGLADQNLDLLIAVMHLDRRPVHENVGTGGGSSNKIYTLLLISNNRCPPSSDERLTAHRFGSGKIRSFIVWNTRRNKHAYFHYASLLRESTI